jgi:endogenous inhibitor of DNA gyrase (YacG/DUF329 family)
MGNPGPACPICGQPASAAERPFCGRRCADVDLGRWLTGQYRIPVPADEQADVDSADEPQAAHGPGA